MRPISISSNDSFKNNIIKNIIVLAFLLLNFYALTAQHTISGSVLDDKAESVMYGNILLKTTQDSSLVKGELSNESGAFKFIQIPNGDYFISISYVGLPDYNSEAFTVNQDMTFPEINLQPATNELEAVVVKAQRPMIEMKADKIVFNVDGSANAAGSDALELMRKAPGVVVDNNDNISLLGKTGVQVYIDGKPSPMNTEQLAVYLKTIPSSSIDAIEIITNPSARYDAEGGAGIINIKMKKDKKLGANGSVNLGQRRGETQSYSGGISGNYRNKKLNVFGSYNYYHSENFSYTRLTKAQNGFEIDSDLTYQNAWNSHYLKGGADYFLDKKSTIGILVKAGMGTGVGDVFTRTPISTLTDGQVESILISDANSDHDFDNMEYNLNYQFDQGNGVTYNVDANYGIFNDMAENYLPNSYFDPTETILLEEKNYLNPTASNIDIKTFKVDHERPFDGGNISAGIKIANVNTDNSFDLFEEIDGATVLDIEQSTDFNYKEQVNAAYISNSKKLGKFSYNYGLRAEQTHSTGTLSSAVTNKNEKVDTTYFNLFPSAGVSFVAGDNNSWQLNYSRRINRPDYEELNPFVQRLDALTSQSGNPFLKPEYTNKVSLGHTYKHMITTTVSYSRTRDVVSQITNIVGEKGSVIMPENIARQENYSINVSGAVPITKWWSSYNNVTAFHEKYDADLGEGVTLNAKTNTVSLYSQQTFRLPKAFSLEVSGWWNSPGLWGGTFKTSSQGSLDIGMTKKLFDGRATLKISASDILKTTDWKGSYDLGGLIINGGGGWDSRQIKANFSYTFGNTNVKSRRRSTGAEDESGRVKSGN